MEPPLLECVEIDPRGPIHGSVIWLHGLGADGNDFVPLVPELGLPGGMGLRFVFPHAPVRPVTINGGMPMRAWYDIRDLGDGREIELSHVEESSRQLEALIDRELAEGRKSQHILLAGFSQGGSIALYTGLRYAERLAGIIALSTAHPEPDRIAATLSAAGRGLPVFFAHGTRDPMIPLARAERSRDRLLEAGCDLQWHAYPMEHQVSAEEIADLSSWIQQRLPQP